MVFNFDNGDSEILKSEKVLLAHYTTRDTAVEGILATQSLRFSSREKVNDPRESSIRGSSMGWLGSEGESHVSEIMMEMGKAISSHLKIFCLSFSEGCPELGLVGQSFCLPNMWAHYGGNHKGVCFLFDKEKLVKSVHKDIFICCENIAYESYPKDDFEFTAHADLSSIDKNFDGDIKSYVRNHCESKSLYLYYQKDHCWKSEQECRVLVYDEHHDSCMYVDYQDSLVGIVLGLDFDEIYLPVLRDLIEPKTNLSKLTWDKFECKYKLMTIK